MPGFVINGQEHPVSGAHIAAVHNFHDDKRYVLRMGNDGRARHKLADGSWHWVRGLFLHVTGGPVDAEHQHHQDAYVQPGFGPQGEADILGVLDSWTLSDASGGAHLIVGHGGCVINTCDLLTDASYHATSCNEMHDGLEMKRGADALMYEGQLDAVIECLDAFSRLMGVQRQFHAPYRPYRPVPRLAAGGDDCVGFFGHRDQTAGRGPLDPGDPIYDRLLTAGYEHFDYSTGEDLTVWKERQQQLTSDGFYSGPIDGIAGPPVVAALAAAGYQHGLWVNGRPGDDAGAA